MHPALVRQQSAAKLWLERPPKIMLQKESKSLRDAYSQEKGIELFSWSSLFNGYSIGKRS
jgi:hypothetical protein